MKKYISLLIAVVLLLCLTVPAFALGGNPKIVDKADLLSSSEEATLETMAENLANEYNIDVVILTVYSLDGKDITAYADDYFDYNGYGIGYNHSGVLLILSMEYRDWAISTCGDGIDALTDYGQEELMDGVLDYFGDDDYYLGFRKYLNELDYYFEAWENGEPIDIQGGFSLMGLLFAIGIGAVAGGITTSIMQAGMKTTNPQRNAQSYLKVGSYKLTGQRDLFLYSRTTKVRKAESSSGSSRGGSSTHRSSSGRSHGGSRGKF